MSLQVGDVKESISVFADIANIDTFSRSINETADTHRMDDLPLNGQQSLHYRLCFPGAIQGNSQAASLIALNTNLTFSINGSRARGGLYTLGAGIDMDVYNNLPSAFPNPDVLQEFSILSNSYSAVYGGDPWAVVNMATKSGTNSCHGTLHEFLRNTDLNTRNFFAAGRPAFHENQFGANLGAPLILNKTFYFTAYEGNRERKGTTSSGAIVPAALERQGNFSQTKLSSGDS